MSVAETPTPRDLKRLEQLEERLLKSKEDSKAWTAERRELRKRLTAAERAARRGEAAENELDELREKLRAELEALEARAREAEANRDEAEAEIKKLREQVDGLIAENRRLAERLDSIDADFDKLQDAASKAADRIEAARKEASEANSARKEAEKQLKALQTESGRLQERLKLAEAQIKAKDQIPLLPASEVANLVGDLVDQMRGSLGDIAVRDGEIRLKVAFGGVDDQIGLVVPTKETAAELGDALNEVVVRFDRAPKLTGEELG